LARASAERPRLGRATRCAGGEAVDLEPEADSDRRDGADLAVMGFGDGLHDGQAQSGAAGTAISSVVGAVEALADARALVRRDAGTVVGDGETHTSAGQRLDAQGDVPVGLGGVGDGVVEEVAQRLGQPIRIGIDTAVRNWAEREAAVDTGGRGAPQLVDEAEKVDGSPAHELQLLGRAISNMSSNRRVVTRPRRDDP
jgi:hypothetical protein